MKRASYLGLLALGFGLLPGCQEEYPTTADSDLFPVNPVTAQVTLPFEAFAKDLTVWGGYGRPAELPTGVVARAYQGTLDARTLVAWGAYPTTASVKDTTGTIRPDTMLTFVGGRVVAVFDTLTSTHEGQVDLALGAIQDLWDPLSATWARAVDSVGDRRDWSEPGAGPVLPLSTAQWDPTAGDSVVFELDSAAVNLWTDTLLAKQGVRMEATTEGVRLDVLSFRLLLTTKARSNPDTVLELSVSPWFRTFVYQPALLDSEGSLWMGGAPAWRSVIELDLPETVNLSPQLCAQVTCPVPLTQEALVSASLVLRTHAPPAGFQPFDTLRMDVREVLEPSRMPKSPLGYTLAGILGIRIPPEQFGEEAGTEVLVPLGGYIDALIRARTDSTVKVSNSLAFLSSFEPLSLYLASFDGPGDAHPPELRLLLTLGEGVQIK